MSGWVIVLSTRFGSDYYSLEKAALFIICLTICLPPPGAEVATGVGAGAGDGDGDGGSPNEIVMIVIFISTTVTWNHPHQKT